VNSVGEYGVLPRIDVAEVPVSISHSAGAHSGWCSAASTSSQPDGRQASGSARGSAFGPRFRGWSATSGGDHVHLSNLSAVMLAALPGGASRSTIKGNLW